MAQVIGIVKSLQNGEFFVKDAQGAIKTLKIGDQISNTDLVYGAPANPQNAQIVVDVTVNNASDLLISGTAELYVDLSVIEGAFEKEEAVASTDAVDNAWSLSATNTPNPAITEDPTAAGLEETAAGEQGPTDNARFDNRFDSRTGDEGDVNTSLRSFTPSGADNEALLITRDADINDAPIAAPDAITTDEDVPYNGTLPVASDVDGDAVAYALGTPTQNGTVTLNANGTYVYTPNENYNGPDSFTYTISDGNGGTNTYTVDITVNPINDAPTIVVDSGNENNATDTVYEAGLNTNTATGTHSSDSAYPTQATGTFTIADPDGLDDITSITVEGTTFTIGSGGFDALIGKPITPLSPTYGSIVITDYDDISGVFTYEYTLTNPVTNDAPPLTTHTQGQDAFTVSVNDGTAPSASATATIDIVDDSPTVTPAQLEPSFFVNLTNYDFASSAGYNNSFGYYVKGADGVPTTGVVIWDGVHNSNMASVAITGYSQDQIGFFIIPNGNSVNSGLGNGNLVTFDQNETTGEWQVYLKDSTTPLNATNGHILFDNPSLNFDANFAYVKDTSLDGNLNWEDIAGGGDKDNNDVNINADWTSGVLAVDESRLDINATAEFKDAFTFNFGADGATKAYALSVNVGSTGLVDTATNTAVTLHVNGNEIQGRAGGGEVVFTLSVDADGKVTLDQIRAVIHSNPTNPDDSVSLPSGLITLTASIVDSDSDSASAPLDIGSMIRFEDDAPVAQDDAKRTNEDAIKAEGDVLANDTVGADGAQAVYFTKTSGTYGTLTFDVDGKYTYTLGANAQTLKEGQEVQEIFDYTLTDKDGDTTQGKLTITITGTNDAPIIDLDSMELYTESFEGLMGDTGWTKLGNSSFTGDDGIDWTTSGDSNHNLEIQNNGVTVNATDGHALAELDSNHLVTLSTQVTLTDTNASLMFDYHTRPNHANDSDMKVSFGNSSFEINFENGTPSIINEIGDIDVSFTAKLDGWYRFSVGVEGLELGNNTLTFQGTGISDSYGALIDNIAFKADTGTGYETTFIENSTPVSIADIDIAITDADDTHMESAIITLTNPHDGDVLVAGTMPSGITATLSGNTMTLNGHATIEDYEAAIRAITYESTSENPSTEDRLVNVSVNDGNANSNTALTTVFVIPVNDAPIARDDGYLIGGDLIKNGSFENVTVASTTGWGVQATAIEGWTFSGNSTMEVVKEGYGGVLNTDGTQMLDMDASPGNMIVTQSDVFIAEAGKEYQLSFDTAEHSGSYNTSLEVYWNGELIATVNPSNQTMTTHLLTVESIAGNNNLTFKEIGKADNSGTYLDNVQLKGIDSRFETDEDVKLTIGKEIILANDTDADGDELSISGVTQSTQGGSVVYDAVTGSIIYTPKANFSGVDTFEYTISDGHGGTDTATVTLLVDPVADAPIVLMSVGYNGTNSVVNGSFEDVSGTLISPNTTADATYDISDGDHVKTEVIPGWTVVGGPVTGIGRDSDGYVNYMEPHDDTHASIGVTEGENYMDLGASPGNTAITQTIEGLIKGETYELSFDYIDKAYKQNMGADSGKMDIYWNDVKIATLDGNTGSYANATYTVTAGAGDTNTLVFKEIGTYNDNGGMAIDNVKLIGHFQYNLHVTATLVDDSEILGKLVIDKDDLPTDAKLYFNNVELAKDSEGNYIIDVSSGVTQTIVLATDTQLTVGQINEISGSITSTDSYTFTDTTGETTIISDMATTEETALNEVNGTDGNDVLTGTSGNDLIIGGAGNDTINSLDGDDFIIGGTGDDVIDGGAGNDTIVYDAADIKVDGGEDKDTLVFTADDAEINFDDFDTDAENPIDNIEVFDMKQLGVDITLNNLSFDDIMDVTDEDNELTILGDSGDSVDMAEGTLTAADTTSTPAGFDTFTSSSDPTVMVHVEENISQTI